MAYIFIILEYIFLPLIAILASFASKKKLKRTTLSLEEFLEDLNIDIKIICTLGLILYALSMAAHGKGQSNSAFFNNYCWTGIVVGLIGYINIHHSYKFGTISVVNTRVKFFGVYNSLYKDSSWYAIGLILYVVVGLLLHYILDPSDAQNQSSAWIISGYIIISLASIYLCTVFFFFLLNKQAKVYLIKENAHINAYSDAYSLDDEAVKKFKLIIATANKTDPILIGVYDRLYEIYGKKGMINEAEQYLNLLIELLADETINKNKDYLQDAYLTKIDFYQKNRSQTELNELKKNIMKKFPGLL